MIEARLDRNDGEPLKLLFLGAHCDDIEIGCGGTVLKLLDRRRDSKVLWVVLGSNPERKEEAERSAELFLRGSLEKEVLVRDFRDGYFPHIGAQIKDFFEELKGRFSPDLIFTHHRDDLHQDHRLVGQLTWNTWRDHLILEYEIPKYDADLGTPNLFVRLDESLCRRKAQHILEAFPSQRERRWFTEDTFLALLRLRGVECACPERFAEAFHCRKLLLAG